MHTKPFNLNNVGIGSRREELDTDFLANDLSSDVVFPGQT